MSGRSNNAIILGAGGTGKELATWIPSLGYEKVLFLDDSRADQTISGKFSDWPKYRDYDFFVVSAT